MTASLNPYIAQFGEEFDVGKSSHYKMAIQFALGGLSFALLDTETQTFVGLECYQSELLNESNDLFHCLERALEVKGLNDKDFQSVTCLIDERICTFVPKDLFNEKEIATYLEFGFQIHSQDVLSEPLATENCVNVFAVDKALLHKIRSKWPKAQVRHSSSVFIESSMRLAPRGKSVFVHVRNRDFDMLIQENGKLLFFNNFKFNTKEDFAYFLMFAMEQNGLSGNDTPVWFSGLLLPASEIVELCKRYILDIRFVEDTHELQVSKALTEVPFQYYFIHYQTLKCES